MTKLSRLLLLPIAAATALSLAACATSEPEGLRSTTVAGGESDAAV